MAKQSLGNIYPKANRVPKPFGRLSRSGRKILATELDETQIEDDEFGYEKEEFDIEPRKNLYYYRDEIRKFALKGPAGLQQALKLFEEMKVKARLEPKFRNYSLLINACSKAGYTQRAFELYREYRSHEDKPSRPMITSLINACSESPFKEYGLTHLEWLRKHLREDKNYKLNLQQYNCMIKAYGKLGKVDMIQDVMDEMQSHNISPDALTFDMLLIACASDRESGTTLALRIYKRMILYGMKPSLITYRIFLRCIRDCGMGSIELLKKTFSELPYMTTIDQQIKLKKTTNKESDSFVWLPKKTDIKSAIISGLDLKPEQTQVLDIRSSDKRKDVIHTNLPDNKSTDLSIKSSRAHQQSMIVDFRNLNGLLDTNQQPIDDNNYLPNLLSDDHVELFTIVESIDLSKTRLGKQRLLFFGGIDGYLQNMVANGVIPDNKTFSLLLHCIETKRHDLLEYYRLALDYKIALDPVFFEILIKTTCQSLECIRRLDLALYFIDRIHIDTNFNPQPCHYEPLAYGCDGVCQASQLIRDLESCGFVVNNEFYRNLMYTAHARSDYEYANGLIDIFREKHVKPDKSLVSKLEDLTFKAKDIILKYEKKLLDDSEMPPWFKADTIEHYDKFVDNMEDWLKSANLERENHPWDQFYVERTSKRTGFENFVKIFRKLQRDKYNGATDVVAE